MESVPLEQCDIAYILVFIVRQLPELPVFCFQHLFLENSEEMLILSLSIF